MSGRFTLCPTKFAKCPRCGTVGRAAEPALCPCNVEREPWNLPGAQPAQFDNLEATRQRPLFDGLGCLPGQQDLF
jgi:hypothetical protein